MNISELIKKNKRYEFLARKTCNKEMKIQYMKLAEKSLNEATKLLKKKFKVHPWYKSISKDF